MTLKHNKGVTLIELMIVLVIAAVLVGGIYTLFTTQQRSYSVQDQVSGVQQDARVALDLMARDIRMAGFQTGPGSSTGFNDIPIVGTIIYAVSITSGGTSSPDGITLVTATDTGARVLGINEDDPNDNYIYLDSLGSLNVDDAVNDYVAFEGLTGVYIIKTEEVDKTRSYPPPPATPTDTVPAITLTKSIVTPRPTLPPPDHLSTFGVSGDEARVYLVQVITYTISNNILYRNGQPLAGDGTTTVVEDLQFAHQVEGGTTWYNPGTFPPYKGAEDIRMVRLSLVVRTAVPDPEDTTFNQPSLEDHTGSLAGPDGFRRRVYTSVVKVRNL